MADSTSAHEGEGHMIRRGSVVAVLLASLVLAGCHVAVNELVNVLGEPVAVAAHTFCASDR